MNFEQRVLSFIEKKQLITRRGVVVAGVSGGADSMALLLALAALRHTLGIQVHAAHFNHRLRPQASHDEHFVAGHCSRLNVPLTVGRRSGGRIKHLSEDAARQMRFKFFIRTAVGLRAQAVALAHTRNDLAETVLMRLIRGSGLYGLRAILPKRSMEGVHFIRPLMAFNRREVEDYLKAQKVAFCTDATNHKIIYERNKVRLKLLPLLAKEYNPQIVNALADLAQTSVEDYEFLSKCADKQFNKSVRVRGPKVQMDLKSIRRVHPAILRLALRQMAGCLTHDPAALGFEHIQALENLAAVQGPGRLDLSHGLKAVKTPQYLELHYV